MDILTLSPMTANESDLSLAAKWFRAAESSLSIVTPELAGERPLGELVQAALAAAAGDSQNTTRAYQTSIGLFLAWLGEELRAPYALAAPTKQGKRTIWEYRGPAKVLRLVNAGSLDNFAVWRKLAGDSPNTASLRARAVRSFLRVAFRDGVLTQDQAANMGLRPYKKREKRDVKPTGRRLGRAEVRLLRDVVKITARNETKAARDRALIDCMLFAGLRRSEISGYKSPSGEWEIMPLNTGSLRQDGGRWWIWLTGKGGKTRKIKAHDTLFKSLEGWARRAGLTLGEGEEPLFCNLTKSGKPSGELLSASVIGRLVAEYGHAAGLAPRHGENCLSPHDLRRTAARNAYDNGASLPQVQAFLGHASPQTTMVYIGSLEDDDHTAVDCVNYSNGG
jgi:integrase